MPAPGKRLALLALCVSGTLLFVALGAWQIQRLAWKRDLVARVDARIHAPPVAIPGRGEWATLDAHDAEYRRVQARGVFRHDRETRVDALTQRGAGWWVLTPLETAQGTVLINRGFVVPAQRDPSTRAAGQAHGDVVVTGLLRVSEPRGRILRDNEPALDRWFSRDVAAIAQARGLTDVAPFFIDADATANAGGAPLGGLTVVQFRNAHLAYAATWLALAAMCVAGLVLARRAPNEETRSCGPLVTPES
ncbi:MAG: SURF1 family protein [Steroidobacteraceae bacterium]